MYVILYNVSQGDGVLLDAHKSIKTASHIRLITPTYSKLLRRYTTVAIFCKKAYDICYG